MNNTNSGPMDWAQQRAVQHVMTKGGLPFYDAAAAPSRLTVDALDAVEEQYRQRAHYFLSFGMCFSQLGTLPGELRLSIEPLHPVPDLDRTLRVTRLLTDLGIGTPAAHQGLSLISRAMVNAYHPVASLFDVVDAPASHPDLFLFDPLTGFVIWREGEKVRNTWLGNWRDLVELQTQQSALKDLLLHSQADHFCPGRSLLMRLIGPLLPRRRYVVDDDAGIPTIVVKDQHELDGLVEDLRIACARAPLQVSAVFRGQTQEHRLPDRQELVASLVTPYSDVRDHSIVPSLYRHYDGFLDNPLDFRAFVAHLLDWNFYSDMVFGDPASYFTLDGQPYVPKSISDPATASCQVLAGDPPATQRAFHGVGLESVWTVTGADGTVQDRYVKRHALGRDDVRRNLVLQHYGAPTSYVDVTRDIKVAEWFAFNKITVEETGLSASGMLRAPFRDPVIFVFLVPQGMAPLVDTEHLTSPGEALRPHRQACAVLGGAGNLYRNAASRFIGLKIKFADEFRPMHLPSARHLFPGPDEDDMLKQLLALYEAPADLPKRFPVYWFPE
ncbi:MAG: FRG domain-containing protein [Pseudomonadota bacterium]